MHKKDISRHILIALIFLVLIMLPAIIHGQPFLLHMVIMSGVYIILAASLRLVYLGNMWLVGPTAFYGMGAYGILLLTRETTLSYWLCLPLVGIGVAVIALGFGYITLRVKGIYFAILSIAFIEVMRLIYVNTLGSHQMLTIPPPDRISITNLLTIDFSSKVDYYYLILLLVIISLVILYRIERSEVGGCLHALTQNEFLAESIGIKVMWYQVLALCVCAFFVSIAGSFFAPYNQTISPESFTVGASMIILIYMVVGGIGSFWGPIIGAILLTIVPEYLPVDPFAQKLIYATLVILTLYFLPAGLMSLPQVIQDKIKRNKLSYDQ
ncbi:MAG: branched-chain amino acid ABC transporter permease [Dehalococcoidia bacterium]|nr:branched-chain amino acid ABC transporter permease [Dehalococcoidia bacterium]